MLYENHEQITHEEADSACDQISFVSAALASMLDTYASGITCGCMSILNNATEVLQAYVNQRRHAEWEAEDKAAAKTLGVNND